MFRRRYTSRRRYGLRSIRRRRYLRSSSWRRRFGRTVSTFRRRYGAKSFKKRSSRFRKRFSRRRFQGYGRKAFAKKVINALVPVRSAHAVYQQEHTVPALTTGLIPARYFACEAYDGAATIDTIRTVELFDVRHLGTLFDLCNVGSAATTQTAAIADGSDMFSSNRQKMWVSGTMVQTLRNQCTEPITLTAYYCRPRGNITFSDASTTGTLYQWLSAGFANNGLDPALIVPSTNRYMFAQEYSPFQSLDFTRDFKITKVKKINIQPGQFRRQAVKNKRGFVTHPLLLFTPQGTIATTSWNSQQNKYQFIKQSRFILYKLHSNIGGYGGAEQGTYSKLTQTTKPTVVMRTNFVYKFRANYQRFSPSATIEFSGIANNGATASAIIVPDAASVGVVSNAY